MKKMIKSVFAAIVLCGVSAFVSPVYAQHGYTPVERRAVDKALSVIEDYETASSLSDDDAYDSFISLFASEDAEVYNDLLGLSDANILKAGEYAEKQRQSTRNSQVFISDIRRENLWKDGDNWKVQFAFDKTISYTNKCGVYFSSNDFYGVKHHLHAVLVYDTSKNVCKIERITGKIDSDNKLPENFYTLQGGGEMAKGLKYKGQSIQYNSYGQAYLEAPVTKNQFSYSDADVVATPKIDEECRMVSMSYSARKWAVKAHYDMGLGKPYKFGDNNFSDSKSSSNSFGLDFGYIIPSKSKMKVGIFVGVGMSQSKLDMAYSNSDYYYTTNQDAIGDLDYVRHYEGLSMSQTYKMSDIVVPVYGDFDIHFSRFVSLYVDLGVKLNINASHKVDATQVHADGVHGIYTIRGKERRFDGNSDKNGFGTDLDYSGKLLNSDIQNFSSFTLDAMGGAGLRFGVPKIPVYLDLGINYQYGLMNVVKNSSPASLVGDRTDAKYYDSHLVYNTVSGITSTEHVRNLIEGVSSLKRNRLTFNIGLIYKF